MGNTRKMRGLIQNLLPLFIIDEMMLQKCVVHQVVALLYDPCRGCRAGISLSIVPFMVNQKKLFQPLKILHQISILLCLK